jgi:NAD(P)-dependent dehydrogenase (short-subunit alcohol dehydrogenase family)
MRGHAEMKDPIASRFGTTSTAANVIDGIDLSGKRAIITGGSSGIGIESARALARAGAEVTIASRDTNVGDRVAAEIASTTGARVQAKRLDLADQASIADFVANWTGSLDLLINNAGVLAVCQLELSPTGWERQFATNHLGHFALACGLHDSLAANEGGRIVSLSSVGHRRSPVVFDDINFASRPYDIGHAYGQSKTANVLFAVEATRRWAGDGITANAVHPGRVDGTNLLAGLDPDVVSHLHATSPYSAGFHSSRVNHKSLEQGAATSIFVATSQLLEGVSGRYFEDCHEAQVLGVDTPHTTISGVATYALDPEAAARLWQISVDAIVPR